MKSTATDSLQAALKNHTDRIAELAELRKLSEATTARRLSLETTCDLGDETALAEITRLQVMEALLPRRIEQREGAMNTAESDVMTAAHNFISSNLGPRIRATLARVRAKVRTALKEHMADERALDRAIDNSVAVVEFEKLSFLAVIRDNPSGGVAVYATQLIEAWNKCAELEAKHL